MPADTSQCDFLVLAVQDREFKALLRLADHAEPERRLGDTDQEFRLRRFDTDPVLLHASKTAANSNWHGDFSYPYTAPPRLHFGPVLSGDKVVASAEFAAHLLRREPAALSVEMEGGGVAAAVARMAVHVRFLMIRGVVDLANSQKRQDAKIWLDSTCEAMASFTVATCPGRNLGKGLPIDFMSQRHQAIFTL